MTNLLKAIKTIVDNPIPDLVSYYQGRNRINSVGDALECFIKNPILVYNYLDLDLKNNKYLQIVAIMRETKYLSFPLEARKQIEHTNKANLISKNTLIKSPNNLAQLIPAKVIIYTLVPDISR